MGPLEFLVLNVYWDASCMKWPVCVKVLGGYILAPPRQERSDRLFLLDREAEVVRCRRSHGACTVRRKVTLIIHEQPCKQVSALRDKSSVGGSQWSSRRLLSRGQRGGHLNESREVMVTQLLDNQKSVCVCPMWDLDSSLLVSFHFKTLDQIH